MLHQQSYDFQVSCYCSVYRNPDQDLWEEPPKKPVLTISMWDDWHLPARVFKASNKTPSFRGHVVQCTFLWGGKVLGFALSLKPLQQKVTVRKGSPKRQCHGEASGRPGGQAKDKTEQPRVCGLLVSHLRPHWGSEPSKHHPICGQECILLFGVSGQRQHCIEAAEVMEAKNCSWLLILTLRGWGKTGWAISEDSWATLGWWERFLAGLLIWKAECWA